MNVLDGYRQGCCLIDEPGEVELAVPLIHKDSVILVKRCRAKLHNCSMVSIYRLVHHFKTAVTWHTDSAGDVQKQFIKASGLAYRPRHMQQAALQLCIFKRTEELVIKAIVKGYLALCKAFQINLELL